jgi:hypothetical protein
MIQIGVVVETVDTEGILGAIAARTRDLSPVFRGPIDRSVTEFFGFQFGTSGFYGNGTFWAPLKPDTIRRKSRPGRGLAGPAAILQDTRELWASFLKSGGPGSVRFITPRTYQRGSSLEKAQWAQEGRGGVPPREIVPGQLPERVTRAWAGMIEAFVTSPASKHP